MIDPAVAMALAVQSRKGVYALLLGSGMSRAAGVPTGFEVVEDLIRRLAAVQKEDVGVSAEGWYREKYKTEPSYSQILELLASTPAERRTLLQGYFEPDEEERQRGLKSPTAGHQAIAKLVASGHIRVIVTTNFDRLLERAIEAEGISPFVVCTEDQVDGMMPLPHMTNCLIFKIHGDYLDSRLRNTPAELERYPDKIDELLNRIFLEYGLIVCGWSGEWDVALKNAIVRNTRFRFSTYWLAYGAAKSSEVKTPVESRQPTIVPIESADKAFTQLLERVEAIEQQRLADPVSPRIAIAIAKRLLSAEHHRIEFNDLVERELKELRRKTSYEAMPLSSPVNKDAFRHRVEQMTAACAVLAPIVFLGVTWDKGNLDELWRRSVSVLARYDSRQGLHGSPWQDVQFLPATIIAYSACAAALISKRFDVLRVVLLDAEADDGRGARLPAIKKLGLHRVLPADQAQWLYAGSKMKTPGSDWMVSKLGVMLADVLPPHVQFEELWDELEFVVSLVSADANSWAMPGRFMWRQGTARSNNLVEQLRQELQQVPFDSHYLIKAGLFADKGRLQSALDHVAKMADLMYWKMS